MYSSHEESSHSQDLRIENELAEMKLALERGAKFYKSSEADLPPEIESEWLKNIQQFEEMYEQCKRITVYEFCGKPVFKKPDDLQEGELKAALHQLQQTLSENNVELNALSSVDDNELYRFITTELFTQEMDDLRIPGMIHCFIYEEFFPEKG